MYNSGIVTQTTSCYKQPYSKENNREKWNASLSWCENFFSSSFLHKFTIYRRYIEQCNVMIMKSIKRHYWEVQTQFVNGTTNECNLLLYTFKIVYSLRLPANRLPVEKNAKEASISISISISISRRMRDNWQ